MKFIGIAVEGLIFGLAFAWFWHHFAPGVSSVAIFGTYYILLAHALRFVVERFLDKRHMRE